MSRDLSKPSPEDAIAGGSGTFSLNQLSGSLMVDPTNNEGFNMISIGHSETTIITELYVNNDPTNVANNYMLNVGGVFPKFELIIAKKRQQFTGIVWSGGALNLVR